MCNQCAVVAVNGTPTHETGCPNSWLDAGTGEPLPWVCFECDSDYTPEFPPRRHDICPDCKMDDAHAHYNAGGN